MSVVIETTLGDITVDLYLEQRPRACINFLKLCKMKYYNFNLFHTVNRGFIAQTGDPTGSGSGGESIWGVLEGPSKRYFVAEDNPRIKHKTTGLLSFVGDAKNMIGSQFFITLAPELTYLDAQHCVFGEVVEGFDILQVLNESICDNKHRPYQDIRITHTVVLDDPFPDPANLQPPDASPERTAERLQGGRIAPDEEIDETVGKSGKEIAEMAAEREAKARATILEMVGDIPDAEMAPPENVLFVCKLNPVTSDDDLEIIFSRFGKIKSCEVIRDKKTGDSLQYAFVEFTDKKPCEDAYFKMDNVLIDDRRIHVDFSQSVAKVKWLGKGRGVKHFNDKGERTTDVKNDIGNGRFQNDKRKRSRERSSDKTKYDRPENGRNETFNRYRNDARSGEQRRRDDYRGDRCRAQKYAVHDRRDRYDDRRREDRPRQRSRSREDRPRQGSRSREDRPRQRSRSREDRPRQRSRSREDRPRQRSRSREDRTPKHRPQPSNGAKPHQKDRPKDLEKVKRKKKVSVSDSSEEEIKKSKKKKKKSKKKARSSDSDSSTPAKKSKKKKSKKSKHKSDSESDEPKVRKKNKKRKSSSDSDSSESAPKKSKRGKRARGVSDSDSSDSDAHKKRKSKR